MNEIEHMARARLEMSKNNGRLLRAANGHSSL